MSTPPAPPSTESAEAARDQRDLRRGAVVNLLGNLFKLADPVLLVAVFAAFGAERFGTFYFAQAVVLLLLRVCLVGMDKALLWWVPREPDRRPGPMLVRAAWLTLGLASATVLVSIAFVGPELMARFGRAPESAVALRLLVVSLPLLVALELLTHATMGTRRMETNMLVKDIVLPVAFPGIAMVLAVLGWLDTGLGLAYFGANAAAVVVAWLGYRRQFRDRLPGTPSPPGLLSYALPMWAAEVSNSLLQRVDVLMVEALTTDMALVGTWGIVTKVSNALRAIRRSFDPVVAAIAGEPSVSKARLREVMGQATFMVSAIQVPVVVFLLLFARDLLGLFGGELATAGPPLIILAVGWLVASTVGLAGVALYARGHARLHLMNVLGTIVVIVSVGFFTVPRWGLVGTAISVVAGYLVQAVVQAGLLRRLAGVWGVDWGSLRAVGAGALAVAAATPVAVFVGWTSVLERSVVFAVFAATYGALVWRGLRSGVRR